jgi:hypothetical protein
MTMDTLPSASMPRIRAALSTAGSPRTSTDTVTGTSPPVARSMALDNFGLQITPAAASTRAAAAARSTGLHRPDDLL